MNVNQLINMVMRQLMRRLVNKGVDAGLNKVSGGGKQARRGRKANRASDRGEG